jgi:hypothetical protein
MTQENPSVTWDSFPTPCYDPQERYGDCPETLLDIINNDKIPVEDRIWAFSVCTDIENNVKRMFTVRCIRETPISGGRFVFDLLTDQRSIAAVEISEAFALGNSTSNDLSAAWDAAWDASRAAAWAAARDAQIKIIKSMLK